METKTLAFYGASDDNFIYDVNGNPTDEIGCWSSGASWKVYDPDNDEGLIVFGMYAPDGVPDPTWMIGVSQLDEGKNLPNWQIALSSDAGYTPILAMTVPIIALITQVYPAKED